MSLCYDLNNINTYGLLFPFISLLLFPLNIFYCSYNLNNHYILFVNIILLSIQTPP
jgi:hypothetical protein